MYVIQNETVIKKLHLLAEREHRSIDEILENFLADVPELEPQESLSQEERIKAIHHKAYAKARRYWESVGDTEKANLTDEQLEEQFQWFDEEGIPRLKSELTSLEPTPGSLAYAAKMAEEANIHLGDTNIAARADEILNAEFADYLFKRMGRTNATE